MQIYNSRAEHARNIIRCVENLLRLTTFAYSRLRHVTLEVVKLIFSSSCRSNNFLASRASATKKPMALNYNSLSLTILCPGTLFRYRQRKRDGFSTLVLDGQESNRYAWHFDNKTTTECANCSAFCSLLAAKSWARVAK